MVKVKSSNVHSVGYDKARRELYVKFHTGATYVYAKVPEQHAVALVNAESVGGYLSAHIKDRYESQRLHEPKK